MATSRRIRGAVIAAFRQSAIRFLRPRSTLSNPGKRGLEKSGRLTVCRHVPPKSVRGCVQAKALTDCQLRAISGTTPRSAVCDWSPQQSGEPDSDLNSSGVQSGLPTAYASCCSSWVSRLCRFVDFVLQQLQGPKYVSKFRRLLVEHIAHGAVVTFQRGNLIMGWSQSE